jgi:hypothetical protein
LSRRFVTVRTQQERDGVDLELPGDRPIREWLPELLQLMGVAQEGPAPVGVELRTEDGQALAQASSLDGAGVRNSDVLWLLVGAAASAPSSEARPEGAPAMGEAPAEAEFAATPVPDRLVELGVIREPCLVGQRGLILMLGHPPIRIGRSSRGHRPDIDLTELDLERTASRHHATITLEGDGYQLVARPTTNGTLLNGQMLQPETPHPLHDGDQIQFGAGGVLLTFYSGRGEAEGAPR